MKQYYISQPGGMLDFSYNFQPMYAYAYREKVVCAFELFLELGFVSY